MIGEPKTVMVPGRLEQPGVTPTSQLKLKGLRVAGWKDGRRVHCTETCEGARGVESLCAKVVSMQIPAILGKMTDSQANVQVAAQGVLSLFTGTVKEKHPSVKNLGP